MKYILLEYGTPPTPVDICETECINDAIAYFGGKNGIIPPGHSILMDVPVNKKVFGTYEKVLDNKGNS